MKKIALDEAVSSFDAWRMQRRYKTEPIPESLRAMAASLYPGHKVSIICNRLRLSRAQLAQFIEDHADTDNDGFVMAKIPVAESPETPDDTNKLIMMTLAGKQRSLDLSIDVGLLPQVLGYIGELL